MSQDDRTPSFPHRHAARFGYPFPPLGGADGETDPAPGEGEGTPSPEAQLGIEPPALPFSYDDVPETLSRADATVWLKAREAQMRSGMQKAIDQAITARKTAESALTVQQRLENEETRREAIEELLEPYNLDIEWPEANVEGVDDDDLPLVDDTELEAMPDPRVDEIDERTRRVEERLAAEDDTAAEERWVDHVTTGLEAFARREGIKPQGDLGLAESIPKPIRDTLLANALAAPRIKAEDGSVQLDIEAAVAQYDLTVEHVARAARSGYIGSKDTPTITLGGGAADPHTDLSTQEARLAAGMKIAQRHLG